MFMHTLGSSLKINSLEINSHEINSREINSPEINSNFLKIRDGKEGLVFGDASSTRVEVVLEEPLQRVHPLL